jgi:hypothetical protein
VVVIDNHSDFVHPTDGGVRVLSQVLGIFLPRFGGFIEAVVRPKLVPVKMKINTSVNVDKGAPTLYG